MEGILDPAAAVESRDQASSCTPHRPHDAFLRYPKEPAQFRLEAEAKIRTGTRKVFVDEVQRVPELLDEIRGLIERPSGAILLTGSSARKLERRGTNRRIAWRGGPSRDGCIR